MEIFCDKNLVRSWTLQHIQYAGSKALTDPFYTSPMLCKTNFERHSTAGFVSLNRDLRKLPYVSAKEVI